MAASNLRTNLLISLLLLVMLSGGRELLAVRYIVDDMESYTPWNLAGDNIFEAWRDGMGNCITGNGNETGANLAEAPSALSPQAPVLGGIQSMQYDFDNDGLVFNPCTMGQSGRYLYSKIEAQIAALPSGIGSDWTVGGVNTLSLGFHGWWYNDLEPLWVQLQDGTTGYGTNMTALLSIPNIPSHFAASFS